jgi:hypothetical protein
MPGTWNPPENSGPFGATEAYEADAMLLLTDGSVLVHDSGAISLGAAWYRLTPSIQGDYSNGTWTGPFSMQYQRDAFGSGVMADGRVFVVGGEYTNDPNWQAETVNHTQGYSPTGEIFDPDTNTWSLMIKPLAPSPAFNYIAGDTPCCVLADGRVIFGAYDSSQSAIYHPTTATWVEAGTKFNTVLSTRSENCNEETWTLLTDGSVLTVCTWDTADRGAALRYLPSLDAWISAGNTPNELVTGSLSHEIGPAILLPNGQLFAIGATGYTALYGLPSKTLMIRLKRGRGYLGRPSSIRMATS